MQNLWKSRYNPQRSATPFANLHGHHVQSGAIDRQLIHVGDALHAIDVILQKDRVGHQVSGLSVVQRQGLHAQAVDAPVVHQPLGSFSGHPGKWNWVVSLLALPLKASSSPHLLPHPDRIRRMCPSSLLLVSFSHFSRSLTCTRGVTVHLGPTCDVYDGRGAYQAVEGYLVDGPLVLREVARGVHVVPTWMPE
ncbi:hypothetical protein CEXT_720421 [Caerostris extrusa]|uniref:Uncharacterized protein n=1 Tax=Caerostris extrusa TaxID=172846 RepID=A0AAV4N9W0_CAEEX|nr:hypothetical protein CEXT_720421 [Caerostris extrusa]